MRVPTILPQNDVMHPQHTCNWTEGRILNADFRIRSAVARGGTQLVVIPSPRLVLEQKDLQTLKRNLPANQNRTCRSF